MAGLYLSSLAVITLSMQPDENNVDYQQLFQRLQIGNELLWEPIRVTIPGTWTGHIAFAFWLVKALTPRIFVELGTHTGNSYSAFCQAIARFGLSSRAFAVDTWQDGDNVATRDDMTFKELGDFHERHFASFSKLVRSSFDEARTYFGDGSIDLLHIKGLHTYEAAKHGFELWLPALSSRAVVLFSHIDVRESDSGVWRFWEELTHLYPSFAFHHSGGLGVLGAGLDQPSVMRHLFELGSAHPSCEAELFRRIFAVRGTTFQLRCNALDAELQLKNLAHEHREQVQRANTLRGEVLYLREALEESRQESERLAQRLVTVDRERHQLHEELARQQSQTDDLERRLKEEQTNAERLRQLAQDAQQQYRDAQRQYRDAQRQYCDAQRQCEDARRQLQAAEKQVHSFEEAAHKLESELVTVHQQLTIIENSRTWRALSRLRSVMGKHPVIRQVLVGAAQWIWWTITLQLPMRLKDVVRFRRQREKIADSALFDARWYVAQYPDVALAGMDPATHYTLHGGREGRNPGPNFDAKWYLSRYGDVANAGLNPLLHYLEFGIAEGRECRGVATGSPEQPTTTGPEATAKSPGNTESADATIKRYQEWVKLYDTLSVADIEAIKEHISALTEQPLISVVMPVFNPRLLFLREALDSVLSQLYPNWELCVADDASTDPEVAAILREFSARDPRVKTIFRNTNGHIAAASNSALELVTGDFVAFMDHDDVLPAHALYMVALKISQHPKADIIYSDEDYLDENGLRQDPHFKPEWNQELLYSENYINHLGVYRTSLVRKAGGFREGYEGSQDYDLSLRVIANTLPDRIRHIPHVLYHWRWHGNVDTYSTSNLQAAVQAAHRALRDYFTRAGKTVEIKSGINPLFNRVIRGVPSPAPSVSVIIPTRNRADLLKACIDGLLCRTDYDNLEVLVVHSGNTDAGAFQDLDHLQGSQRVKVIRGDAPFSHSLLSNLGAEHATGELLLFLSDDIEVIDSGWLKEMVAQSVQPGVGAVGAKLYYRDDTVQHAGMVLGIGGTVGHGHRHMPRWHHGYGCRLQLVQNVSCVTGACLLMPKALFEEVGRFDEQAFRLSYDDVDLCLRIGRAGYKIVWTPYAELYHPAPASGADDRDRSHAVQALSEEHELRRRWGTVLLNDPMYSPNLTLQDESFGYAFPPRAPKPWLNWKSSGGRVERGPAT